MANYKFSEFLNSQKSDEIPHLFSTTKEVNDLIAQIITTPEVKARLFEAEDFREFCYTLFDEIDNRLEIDSLKDMCYISFRVGMAAMDTYKLFQLEKSFLQLKEQLS